MPDIILYNIPPSFYSQIARLVLHELEVPFKSKMVAPGPPTFESYKPWYMSLNPMGTVPTLVHGDVVIPDSVKLLRYAAKTWTTVQRTPDQEDAIDAMNHWIEVLESIPIRELSYGAENQRDMGHRVNKMRLRNLETRQQMNPGMSAIYANKIEDIRGFSERSIDAELVDDHRSNVAKHLDDLNTLLQDKTWITGEQYSLADTVWTVAVARFKMLNLAPLAGRPALTEWYARVKARPSFEVADVWEFFNAGAMVKMMARKFLPQLVGLACVIALVIWWALNR